MARGSLTVDSLVIELARAECRDLPTIRGSLEHLTGYLRLPLDDDGRILRLSGLKGGESRGQRVGELLRITCSN